MAASIRHTPKVGALLTGAEYEDAAHHVLTDVIAEGDSRLTDSRAPSGSAGGQLSGTYPNPSVAASHSGSTHAATQAAAEATSAVALSAHESDTTNIHGIVNTAALVTITVSNSDPGAVGAGKFWLTLTNVLSIRNADDSGWIEIVNLP